jgi:hypothetical protein
MVLDKKQTTLILTDGVIFDFEIIVYLPLMKHDFSVKHPYLPLLWLDAAQENVCHSPYRPNDGLYTGFKA